jgi:Family of unknown function (DUF6263)
MKKIISLAAISLLSLGGTLPLMENGQAETVIISKKPVKTQKISPDANPNRSKSPNLPTNNVENTKLININQSQLTLINNGIEPRIPMRFTPEVNSKEKLKMSLKMDMEMSMGDKIMPNQNIKMPLMLFTIESNVTKIDTNGDINFRFVVADLDIEKNENTPEDMVKMMRSQFKKVIGLGGNFVVDEMGKPKGGKLEIPKELQNQGGLTPLTEQLTKTLEQISAPIPSEPVGVGAKWTVNQNVSASFMNVQQNIIYEIVSIKDGIITLNVQLEQKALPQQLAIPGMPKDFNFTVKKLDSQGQGQVVISLKKLFPITSNLTMKTDSEMQLLMSIKDPKKQGKPEKIEMNMNMKQMVDLNMKSE